jgi:predicted nucleotide-binding protein (sugar kinase/HSP70/actin superfamily)
MAPIEIHWKAFLRVSTAQKATRLLGRIAKELGEEVCVIYSKPYRKDSDLYETCFTSPLGSNDWRILVFEALQRANRISYRWIVRPPQEYRDGKWDFAGWTDKKTRFVGVGAVEFEVRNY